MDVKEYFNSIVSKINEIETKSLGDNTELLQSLSSAVSFREDMSIWIQILQNRKETIIYKNAIKVYQEAMVCAVCGLYQPAFMGLRYFLERMLAGINFSTNELELITWLRGKRDTYWGKIIGISYSTDGEEPQETSSGVFSHEFTLAYFEELENISKQMKLMTRSVYRDCSEFVHGNSAAISDIPPSLEYSETLFSKWCDCADTVKRCVLYALCVRYLKAIDDEAKKAVKSSLVDEFKTIVEITSYLENYD